MLMTIIGRRRPVAVAIQMNSLELLFDQTNNAFIICIIASEYILESGGHVKMQPSFILKVFEKHFIFVGFVLTGWFPLRVVKVREGVYGEIDSCYFSKTECTHLKKQPAEGFESYRLK